MRGNFFGKRQYGDVEDIYSKDVNGVMFQDGDKDGKLSEDDTFIIKGDNGPGKSGGRFVLKYTVTGKTILSIPLEE